MPQTEMLRPNGLSRVVVDDSEFDAFVAAGYHRIDVSDKEANISLKQEGLAPKSKSKSNDEPKVTLKPETEVATKVSNDVGAKEAIAAIAELDSIEAVETYTDGDDRSTVQGAADAKMDALGADPE